MSVCPFVISARREHRIGQGVMQMNCAWQTYLNILPHWMRSDVDAFGRMTLQELRLRIGLPPELILKANSVWLKRAVGVEDLQFIINCASQYSPWLSTTMAEGYLTAPGGHRIGICGTAVIDNQRMRGIREPTSLCIRVARDFPNIAEDPLLLNGSVLILGPPGSGKTTFLRDLIRQRSRQGTGSISVVDERGELFPAINRDLFFPGPRTDVLRFCGKGQGITAVLKTMGPSCIAVDEITDQQDCLALQQAGCCGVSVLATVHAWNLDDLFKRPLYRNLIESKLFDNLVVMGLDKSWKVETVPL